MLKGVSTTLGPLQPGDFESLFRWANDSDAALLNDTYRPAHWPAQQEWWQSFFRNPSQVIFAIRTSDSPGIIGYVEIGQIDPVHRAAKLGIRIGEAVNRGRGYGSDVMPLAVDYCWRHLNLSRIALTVFAHNTAAIRLYRKAGFKREGVFRRAAFIAGGWVDVLAMAALHPSRGGRKQPALLP